MKKTLLTILPLLLIVGCSKEQPINDETLIEKGRLRYHPDTKELYSGKVFTSYLGGNKKLEGSYKDGKRDGLETRWYENGQKDYEGTYKDGKEDGKWTDWYSNGQKSKEKTYKDGKLISEKCWHEDGNECECDLFGIGCK
jgi:antitoxin component YwqK of YwqJK toxin-antitoxin module